MTIINAFHPDYMKTYHPDFWKAFIRNTVISKNTTAKITNTQRTKSWVKM